MHWSCRPRALSELQGSYQVSTVDKDSKAHIKTVKTGPAFGSLTVIEDGLGADDQVIVEGFQKVKEGGGGQREALPGRAVNAPPDHHVEILH